VGVRALVAVGVGSPRGRVKKMIRFARTATIDGGPSTPVVDTVEAAQHDVSLSDRSR
jgi:hypothetical protein